MAQRTRLDALAQEPVRQVAQTGLVQGVALQVEQPAHVHHVGVEDAQGVQVVIEWMAAQDSVGGQHFLEHGVHIF